MKLYERGSLKRVLIMIGALSLLLVIFAGLPKPTNIPVNADPETLYHTVWQVTAETFYDREKLSDWQSWEHKYDGKLKTQEDAERAIGEMLASLGDRFTYFENPTAAQAEARERQGSFAGVGLVFNGSAMKDGKPYVSPDWDLYPVSTVDGYPIVREVIDGGPAGKAGIQKGDVVIAITDLSKPNATTVDARGLTLKQLTENIRGGLGTKVKLSLRRQGQPVEVTITRGAVEVKSVTYKRLDNGVGYIQIVHFGADNMLPQLASAIKALKDCKGLVVDLRNNPGGQVPNAINGAALFLERGTVVTQRIRGQGQLYEVQFVLTPETVAVATLAGGKPDLSVHNRQVRQLTKLPLVILVNENSASASEMFTGALQDNGRAVVVGVKTVGKGIGQSLIPMPNGTMLHVTSLRYYTPSNRWVGDASRGLYSNGIIPNVVVPSDKYAPGDVQLKAAEAQLQALIASSK